MSAILDALKRSEHEKIGEGECQFDTPPHRNLSKHHRNTFFLWIIAGLSCIGCILFCILFLQSRVIPPAVSSKMSTTHQQDAPLEIVEAAQDIQEQKKHIQENSIDIQKFVSSTDLSTIDTKQVKIIGIKDSCILESLFNGEIIQIRLSGIICPEKGHKFYNTAKYAIAEKLFLNNVAVSIKKKYTDAFWSADVFSLSGILFNATLARQGMAWAADRRFQLLESQAREEKIGIWATASQ